MRRLFDDQRERDWQLSRARARGQFGQIRTRELRNSSLTNDVCRDCCDIRTAIQT